MPKYRVRQGQTHYTRVSNTTRRNLVKHVAGDIVELSEESGRTFRDKLELVVVEDKTAKPTQRATVDKPEPQVVTHQTSQEDLTPVLQRIGTTDTYNIINKGTGKPINDKPLSLEDAKDVLTQARAAVKD